MNLPRFTAEACLGERSSRGRSRQEALGRQRDEPQRAVITPQRGGEGFEGISACIADCQDEHPDWTLERCQAACRGSEGTPCTPHDNSLSRFACLRAQDAWLAFCVADCKAGGAAVGGLLGAAVGLFGCGWACNQLADRFRADCPPAVICT